MNSGIKFWAWVSFHTTILKFWKFQQNQERTVVVPVLPSLGWVCLGYAAYALLRSAFRRKVELRMWITILSIINM